MSVRTTIAYRAPRPFGRLRATSILPALLVLVLAGGVYAVRVWRAAPLPPRLTAAPTNPAIEQRWGIRIKMIGVTADGGLVDVRFLVIDPDKALAMLTGTKNLPVLIAEDSHILVNSTMEMAHRHTINAGETYFLIYRDAAGAIRPGTPVTVRFKGLQLQHVIAA